MNKLSLKAILLSAVLGLIACTNTNNTRAFVPVAAPPDEAVVYIYRPSAMSNAIYSPGLSVNNEYKLAIKNGKSARLSLGAGDYTFSLDADKNYSGLTTLSLNLAAGEMHFIRVDTSLEIQSSTNYAPYKRSFNLVEIDKALAVKEITACCADKTKLSTAEQKTAPAIKDANDGFSVDKTQNPFSQ